MAGIQWVKSKSLNNMNKEFDVLVVGELNVDLIMNELDRFPSENVWEVPSAIPMFC